MIEVEKTINHGVAIKKLDHRYKVRSPINDDPGFNPAAFS